MGGMKGRDLAEGTPSLETRNPAALKPSVNLPRSICSSLKWEWGCWLAGCSGQRWCLLPPALPSCSLWASHGAGTISSNGFLTTTLEGSCNTCSTVRDIWIDYVERVQSKSNERKIDPASIGFIMVCHKVHQRRWKFFHYFGTPSFILLLNHTVVRYAAKPKLQGPLEMYINSYNYLVSINTKWRLPIKKHIFSLGSGPAYF